ncbi:N-glycosylase/DNA lyase isoform X4 [Phasianus colchicus]|uniref:N-glycosylase/DNA lyase isoform X4 n=1 Tax=Phasianus colchicus TaxID=9054 RepID=UPI00129EFC2A|nr:N-glycosylase/DNA lyase isoform X4 [Phasianus colchicus]
MGGYVGCATGAEMDGGAGQGAVEHCGTNGHLRASSPGCAMGAGGRHGVRVQPSAYCLCGATAAPMALRDTPAACPALWRWLRCPPAELRLDLVLASGQAFRWRESSPGAWTGVLGDRVWTLRQERDRLWYTVYGKETPGPETDQILWDYFQLDVGLAALYRAWGAADPLFCQPATAFPGPCGVPTVLHLHLQQPRGPHHHHDRAPLPGLRPTALLAGRAALPRLPLPGSAGRSAAILLSPHSSPRPHSTAVLPQALKQRPSCGRWALAIEPALSAAQHAPSPREWVPRGCASCGPCPMLRPGGCCVPCQEWGPRWLTACA